MKWISNYSSHLLHKNYENDMNWTPRNYLYSTNIRRLIEICVSKIKNLNCDAYVCLQLELKMVS